MSNDDLPKTLWGLPVVVDPSLAPGEFYIEATPRRPPATEVRSFIGSGAKLFLAVERAERKLKSHLQETGMSITQLSTTIVAGSEYAFIITVELTTTPKNE